MTNFYLTFKNGKILKDLVDICKDVVGDINLEITESGIAMQAMDMSHVCLVTFFIDKQEFDEYNIDKTVVLSLSLKSLNLILKCYKEGYKLSLSYTEKDVLQIIFYCGDVENDTDQQYTWNLVLMDIDTEKLCIPDEDYDVEIKMDANEFSTIMKNVGTLGQSLKIQTIGKLLNLQVSGDIGNVEVSKSLNKQKMHSKCNLELSFAMRYILLFIKGSNLTQNLIMKLRNEQPLELKYQITDYSFIQFFLAPKIDD
jgi:proliferating cell nuclear antigen